MNNYFSQFIPNLPFQSPAEPPYTTMSASNSPKINYITIFNPSLSPPRAESNEELLLQILCFISEGGTKMQSVEQLRVIGLMRGIDSFARTFSGNSQQSQKLCQEPSIINSTNSSIIIQNLEPNFYVACSISHNKKSTFVNQQMIKLVEEAYHIFVLLNTSFNNINEKYTLEILQHTLSEFWWGFLESYNSQGYSYPFGLQWPNRLNYKGFLGLIKTGDTRKRNHSGEITTSGSGNSTRQQHNSTLDMSNSSATNNLHSIDLHSNPHKPKPKSSTHTHRVIPKFSSTHTPRTYKKSSLSLNLSTQTEIDQLLNGEVEIASECEGDRARSTSSSKEPASKLPLGLIISNFNKISPKNYGMIYMNSKFEASTQHDAIQQQELIDIYNWLEFQDYHGKLTTESMTNIDNKKVFRTKRNTEEETRENSPDPDIMSLRSTVNALGILPINLVVTPLNYTMNMMTKGGRESEGTSFLGTSSLSGIHQTPSQLTRSKDRSPVGAEEARSKGRLPVRTKDNSPVRSINTEAVGNNIPTQLPQPSGWLSLPPILKNLTFRGDPATSETLSESESEDEPEDHGEFLIGLKVDLTGTKIIHRKLIYLPTLSLDEKGDLVERFFEYLLIIYTKYDINITLIFNSSLPNLDDFEFYLELEKDLEPAIDEIQNSVIGGSLIGSIGSLRSHNGSIGSLRSLLQDTEDFFFVIFDSEEGWVKSSLPYLADTPEKTTNYESAIFHLHDQLSTLFLMQKNQDFFSDHQMSEYFHKFTSNKLNDWMFYYIKHDKKFIIIIKNHNKKRRAGRSGPGAATVSESLKGTTLGKRKPSEISPDDMTSNDQNLFYRLTNGVQDYASLGFLDNLGDDVRSWLEGFGERGET
jgi:hypothetical protein